MHNLTNLKMEWVDRIFLLLHGRFGNSFTNKFKLGQLNASGEDAGIANAKTVWAQKLAGITPERLKAALEANYAHAPHCDEFLIQCVSKPILQDFKALPPPLKTESSHAYADNVVQFIKEKMIDKTDYKAWAKRIIANPKNFPDSSLIAAKEALGMAA